ncbi:MAG: Asp23/Gls24 family envelope stress response protein [Clostridium saudiense]
MKKKFRTKINVANEVVATIAGMAVSKIDGVAKMAGGFTGLKAISGKSKCQEVLR